MRHRVNEGCKVLGALKGVMKNRELGMNVNPLSFQGFFGVNFQHDIFFSMRHGTLVFNHRDFWFVSFLRRKAEF